MTSFSRKKWKVILLFWFRRLYLIDDIGKWWNNFINSFLSIPVPDMTPVHASFKYFQSSIQNWRFRQFHSFGIFLLLSSKFSKFSSSVIDICLWLFFDTRLWRVTGSVDMTGPSRDLCIKTGKQKSKSPKLWNWKKAICGIANYFQFRIYSKTSILEYFCCRPNFYSINHLDFGIFLEYWNFGIFFELIFSKNVTFSIFFEKIAKFSKNNSFNFHFSKKKKKA